MRRNTFFALLAIVCIGFCGCNKENSSKDRRDASEMFEKICRLTEEYTGKLEEAPDSADWAALCTEFEEKLDKVNFSYAPDTDLLLTEGQNDTIQSLLQEYVRIRDQRIHGILHPEPKVDSLAFADSLAVAETAPDANAGQGDAFRSPGN